jgi:hypothetical protein
MDEGCNNKPTMATTPQGPTISDGDARLLVEIEHQASSDEGGGAILLHRIQSRTSLLAILYMYDREWGARRNGSTTFPPRLFGPTIYPPAKRCCARRAPGLVLFQ